MRRSWILAVVLAASGLLAGCDSSGGTATVTPDEARAAIDATKKWREGHSKPSGSIGGSSAAADVLKKKQTRR